MRRNETQLRRNETPSDAIGCTQMPANAIRWVQSDAIRRNQMQSDAISWVQAISSIAISSNAISWV
jgi:hypothetical protein